MLEKGATIVYGSQICTMTDIKDMTFGKITRKYYVLSPVWDDKNVIYVPTDNETLLAKMKRILSAEEIYALVKSIPSKETAWIEDDKERAQQYRKIIENANREEIIRVIKTLFERKKELEAVGRKLHSADVAILDKAEKVIYEEFALVLDIKKENVVPFIAEQIEVQKKESE